MTIEILQNEKKTKENRTYGKNDDFYHAVNLMHEKVNFSYYPKRIYTQRQENYTYRQGYLNTIMMGIKIN